MTSTKQRDSSASMAVPAVDQKRLVIVGATGMVGGVRPSLCTRQLRCEERHFGWAQQTRHHADCSPLANVLSAQDAAVYCLGTYTGSVSDEQLHVTTADYTIEFARVLRGSSPKAVFSFLSGNGADPTGRSRLAFARYKGQAEKALLAAGFPRVFIFRPAYICPVEPRREPNLSYRLLRAVYPGISSAVS